MRDKALALEHYSRQARNTENDRRACEIRPRAERKAEQLLAESEKNEGGAGGTERDAASHTVRPADTTKTLADLGISKTQSSRWH
jgi:hypothetical protein